VIKDSEADTIILETALLENYAQVRSEVSLKREILLGDVSGGPARGMIPFASLQQGSAADLATDIEMSDPITIIYTSGTTGKPKGVVLPQYSYVHCSHGIMQYEGLKEGDRLFSTLPLFHVGAQLLIAVPAMLADIDFALMKRFSASKYWDQVRHYKCNVLHYLGSIAQILLAQPERPDDADNPGERMIGGGIPEKIWHQFEKRFGVKIIEAYGLTECGGVSVHNPIGRVKPGSIGLPVAHQRVEIVDESDRIVPPFTNGEIVIRPEAPFTMMLGYYKNPQATVEACRNLWFHTGDYAYKDEEGYIHFLGRAAYFIRRRGENVSPEEVEGAINSHPEVEESCVVGVPSEMGDEDVKAYIVAKEASPPKPEEIIKWCEEQISYFKIPRYLEFVDSLPKTLTNRVERHKLKEAGVGQCWDREKSGYKLKK
jgi:acyl-coenzyme A synthetase/AMP-(fatty) acid ligase